MPPQKVIVKALYTFPGTLSKYNLYLWIKIFLKKNVLSFSMIRVRKPLEIYVTRFEKDPIEICFCNL